MDYRLPSNVLQVTYGLVHKLYCFFLHFMPIGSMVLRVEDDGSSSDGGIGVGKLQRGGQGDFLLLPNSHPPRLSSHNFPGACLHTVVGFDHKNSSCQTLDSMPRLVHLLWPALHQPQATRHKPTHTLTPGPSYSRFQSES